MPKYTRRYRVLLGLLAGRGIAAHGDLDEDLGHSAQRLRALLAQTQREADTRVPDLVAFNKEVDRVVATIMTWERRSNEAQFDSNRAIARRSMDASVASLDQLRQQPEWRRIQDDPIFVKIGALRSAISWIAFCRTTLKTIRVLGGARYIIFDEPSDDLSPAVVELEDSLDAGAQALQERLAEAGVDEAAFRGPAETSRL